MSPEATGQQRAEQREKSDCGLKGLKRLKRHNPKPVPSFGLDCVLHALVPCLSTDSPMTDSQSFPGSPAPVFAFSVLCWGYDLYLPLRTELTSQHSPLGGCGSGTELNMFLSHHSHFQGRGKAIWHVQSDQFPHLHSPKTSGVESATCSMQKWLLNTSSGHFVLGMHCQARLNLSGKRLNYSHSHGAVMDWMVMEPSSTNFNAFVSNCGHCFMYYLGHQVGNAIIHSDLCSYTYKYIAHRCVYIYIHTMCHCCSTF